MHGNMDDGSDDRVYLLRHGPDRDAQGENDVHFDIIYSE